jgi:transposase
LATTNARSTLAQRGHSKQRRHDLRQLGLALVVSHDGQLPLGHVLYDGARPDGPIFATLLAPLRDRLQRLLAAHAQLTLVFDQGAETTANLAAVRATATSTSRRSNRPPTAPGSPRSPSRRIADRRGSSGPSAI